MESSSSSSQNDLNNNNNIIPRKLTAIGTIGEVGQLFTVYEKNWKCLECSQENYASRIRCSRCRAYKPDNEDKYVLDPALQAYQNGQEIEWKEAIDPNSYQIYYYNTKTGESKWERPIELGPAPHATGWFGRGQSGTMAAELYMRKNTLYLTRPARKQKEFIDPKNYHLEGANEYNIWYGRYLGDHWDHGSNKEKAADRCVLDTDAGYTRADGIQKNKGVSKSGKDKRYFCIHFAHGVCAKGSECTYYHRIPTLEDDARCEELFDCFGRQRHNKHRDDMSGVGSFLKPCRTLFIGGILKHKYDTPQKLEEAVWKHFGEWGEIENVNLVQRLSVVFLRYRVRTSAEFAKEAMMSQSLDKDEILDIRWAHDDPNPVAQDAIERANRDALFALMQAKGISLMNTGFQYPAEYSLPAAKKMRLENGSDLLQQHPELAYPNTDEQYTNTTSSNQGTIPSNMTQEEYLKAWNDYYASIGQNYSTNASTQFESESESNKSVNNKDYKDNNQNQTENETSIRKEEEKEEEVTSSGLSNDWVEVLDDETGATYYYNPTTGESSWGVPPENNEEDRNEEENEKNDENKNDEKTNNSEKVEIETK